jgi:hypothetical protein
MQQTRRKTGTPSRKDMKAPRDAIPEDLISALGTRIEHVAPERLHPNPRNARTHSPRQVERLAAAIRRFGFLNPVIIDENDMVLAGHGRLLAARKLGLRDVPVLRAAHMSEAEKRAYMIADNRIAELAGWDRSVLKEEFVYLTTAPVDFDVGVTGFDTAAVDLMLLGEQTSGEGDDGPEEAAFMPLEGPVVTQAGDLWQLGPHRIACADAQDMDAYTRVLGGEKAAMVFTDPPYNVPIAGHAQGLGKIRHRDFVMASGEMSAATFRRFLERVLGNCAAASGNGSIHYVCMDWRHMGDLLEAGTRIYGAPRNLCVWVKTNAGMEASTARSTNWCSCSATAAGGT